MGLLKHRILIFLAFLAVILPNVHAECDSSLEYTCSDGSCIPAADKCNGHEDCPSGDDEDNCDGVTDCDGFQCEDGTCLDNDLRCDRRNDCENGEDEEDCNEADSCAEDEFFCGDRCIEQERVCDGHRDCTDYRDEYNCTQSTTQAPCPEDQCADGSCIYQYQRCDGERNCPGGEDESGCPCRDNEFQCGDGACIPLDQRCNRQYNCQDGSDERDCTPVSRCRPGEFRCETGECISEGRKCDRHIDCRDGSDENSCPPVQPPSGNRPGLNLKTYPNEQVIKERLIKEGREVVFQCRDEGPIRARVQWSRRNNRPLPPGTRDISGRLEIPNIQIEHGGEYVCEAVGYPKSTPGASVTVHLTVEKYNRTEHSMPLACGANQATCMNGECIAKSKICDGVFDCADGSDENSCREGRCEPNEFKCSNRKCVLKTWRCDGENDCGDNSDEEGCSAQVSAGACRYDEFQCANRQCIPKSFQCDSQSDCSDNTDEIGCIAPAVITPPPPMVRLNAGVVFNITCRATGNPIPLIVWRLNWGHIPEKCRTTSVDGFGTLTCPDIQPIDSGAYSCEIINTMGTHFVSPDTILVVSGQQPTDVCPVGHFNKKAMRREECINCFCFGVSTQCKSADLFSYTLNPPVTSQTVVGVDGPWNGLSDITIGEYDRHTLTSTRHGVQFRVADVPAASNRVYPYLALPSEYLGNQLKSYGGFLRYEVEFGGRGAPNDIPDVIIQGNDYTLTYRAPNSFYPNSKNNVTVQLYANNFYKIDGTYASREEVMMALANIDNILIKLQYIDAGERNVELLHVTMDSAALRDIGLGSATLVEECRCPAGYTGLSCETCDIGYVRQRTGPWLGRCVREEEPCRPGYYGDPSRGISCKQCPCPVAGQSRARTCSLDRSGEVICNCDRGYAGKRCEICDSGYIGNPLSPRGCTAGPVSECNPHGTERTLANGRCECKRDVVGERCDQCSAGSFFLNARSGCINCFCMGVTDQCTSSSMFRDAVRASFASSQSEFGLVAGYDEPLFIVDRLRIENREITYSNFAANDETYYWSLPSSFLGNKLTSYGGDLSYTVRYTPQPSGGASRSNSPDVVIVSGNEITLHHYRQESLPPSGSQTFIVPVYEDSWQHYADGTSANRQHLLMALANVTAIYIKATYTTVAEEAGLSQVSLDISSEQNFGSKQRAWEVEQCSCPMGHQGLSCEDCAPGFYKGDQGLYLGLCEPCECNGHSMECDSKTGSCKNCRDNTYGDNCEVCMPGFFGNATSGGCAPVDEHTQCSDCNDKGTTSCDLRRRTCNCKPNVVGVRCDECREGTFGLSETNEYGCRDCFCSGATKSCSAGDYYREEIPLFLVDEANHFALTDRDGQNRLPEEFEMNIVENEVSYHFNDDSSIFYWNLPERLTGNLILSYGGNLQITQRTDGSGPFTPDQDIIIKGNGITLFYTRSDYHEETYRVPLLERHWQTQNRNGPRPATRADLLTALTNVQSIYVRASLRSFTSESKISDIILETAVRQPTPGGRTIDVEVCRCPPGYRGSSCEQCDNLYYRDVFDRSAGLTGSCKICPCENAESCELGSSRRVQCRCLPGFTGEYCRERVDYPTPSPPRPPVNIPSIKVVINTPQIKIVEIGETTEFNCNAYFILNNAPVAIRWYKYDGAFSERVTSDHDTLFIQDAQVDDSGVYVCQASSGSEVVRDNVTVTVGGDTGYPRAPQIRVTPSIITQEEYSVAEVRCEGSGSPEPRFEWSRLDGSPISSDVVLRDGYLRFNSLRKSDEGSYRCYAQNSAGDADQTIQVYIRGRQDHPEGVVTISPSEFEGEPGVEIHLRCSAQPRGRVTWSKVGAVELPRNAYSSGEELIIRYSTVDDSGRYMCSVQFPSGVTRTSYAEVTINQRSNEQAPKISPLERRYSLTQGADFELTCEVTGTPYPSVTWTINGAHLASNARQTGNVLRIVSARPENSGVYICSATNNAGSDQAATSLDVERREPPTVELFPKESQKLKVGESTRLTCYGTGSPYPQFVWTRRDGRPLSSRFTVDSPGTITLREATIEDTGSYECKATNIAGTTTISTTIEVLQAPTISLLPDVQVLEITEGDELRFTCTAVGVPQPSVSITVPEGSNVRQAPSRAFEAGRTAVAHGEASIFHRGIQRSQGGLYTCTAENEAGQDLRYIQVNVKEKRGDVGPADNDDDTNEIDEDNGRYPIRPDNRHHDNRRPEPDHRRPEPDHRRPEPDHRNRYPHPDPDGHTINTPRPDDQSQAFTVHIGERAEFNCNAEDNSMRTEWRRADGRELPYGARIYGGQLVIENVRADASGQYECLAYDHVTRRPITLLLAKLIVVAGPPKITFSPPMPIVVKSGEDVIIYCNATGEGPLRVHWHGENGQRLPESIDVSGNYLRFNRIAPADEGRYVCTASNHFGNTTKVAEVIVNINTPIDEPMFGKSKEAYEGDTVSLTCSDDNPRGRTRFEWDREYDGLPPLAETRENTLILYNTRFEDKGRYICKIFLEDGRVTQNYVDLAIKPPIPFLKLEPSRSFVKPGDNVEVECTSSVGPHVKVTWQKVDGQSLPFNFEQYGNRLTINNAQKYDSGKYSCVCYTDEGQVYMSEYELNVEDKPAQHVTPRVEHAEVGATVVLRCNSQGRTATYSWSRQHGTFPPELDTSSELLKLINVQAGDSGSYICTARHNGQVVEIPTTLVVTGAIPFFPQSPRSFMKFPKIDQAYSKFNFEITFRPERPNGLILYNGQKRIGGDYIALSLSSGVPQFRYSFGDQQGILAAEKPLTLGEWHTIKVNRVRTNGWMIVDDQHPVVFPQNQKFQGLNLEEELFIGGVQKFENIAPGATEAKEGFVGCISRLVVNERDIQLNQEAIYVEGTTSCEPCADEPCQNEGVCLETQTEHGYTCVCQDGYTGKNCQVEGFQCSLGVCGVGRCGETDFGIDCYCPLNRSGDRCQYMEHYNDGILAFRDGSYAAYDKLTGKKNIKLKIRPENDNDGVILYAAESDRAFGDFIAVVVKDKHIEFRYVVGGKVLPVIIRSQSPVKVDEWMDISVGRSRAGLGYLQVDNEPQINEVKSGGRAQTLYLKTNLYVGGYDKRIVMNRGVGVTKGFHGCVAGLEISGKGVNMIADIQDSANVQNCGHQMAGGDDESSGDFETTSNSPQPVCRPGYTGRHCDVISDVCLAHEPCENSGLCIKKAGNKYSCDCTLGFTGNHCQYQVTLGTDAKFKGNGYLELNRSTISNSVEQLSTEFSVLFSTKQSNGLIFWYGQNKGKPFNGEDFLALSVNNGFLEFAFRQDGVEDRIKHETIQVDTDQRHLVVIKRTGDRYSLELDGLTHYGEAKDAKKKEIVLPGHIFFGGAPDLIRFTGERYRQGFIGCIHGVELLGTDKSIELGQSTVSAVNVDTCSPDDEDDDEDAILGTEPPVV